MRSEILQRVAILRKLNENYEIESTYFTIEKPTRLVIIFKTFDSLEKFVDSIDHEIISAEYTMSLDCKDGE